MIDSSTQANAPIEDDGDDLSDFGCLDPALIAEFSATPNRLNPTYQRTEPDDEDEDALILHDRPGFVVASVVGSYLAEAIPGLTTLEEREAVFNRLGLAISTITVMPDDTLWHTLKKIPTEEGAND